MYLNVIKKFGRQTYLTALLVGLIIIFGVVVVLNLSQSSDTGRENDTVNTPTATDEAGKIQIEDKSVTDEKANGKIDEGEVAGTSQENLPNSSPNTNKPTNNYIPPINQGPSAKECDLLASRVIEDYNFDVEGESARYESEKRAIDAEYNSRGIFNSGPHKQALREADQRHNSNLQRIETEHTRVLEDLQRQGC